ncbi:hypothetical protein [Teichococcus aestuarii]
MSWLVTATLSGLLGLALGALIIPLAEYVLAPLAGAVARMVRPRKAA